MDKLFLLMSGGEEMSHGYGVGEGFLKHGKWGLYTYLLGGTV